MELINKQFFLRNVIIFQRIGKTYTQQILLIHINGMAFSIRLSGVKNEIAVRPEQQCE